MKNTLGRVGRALLAVVHDKDVQRSGKALGLLIAVRLLIAAGFSAELATKIIELF